MVDSSQKPQIEEYPAHWIEGIIQDILKRNSKEIALSTGKTPSGHIHLGILRELLICDALQRILKKKGYDVHYRLFFDSLDAAKRFPSYIPEDYAKNYIGQPFAKIPDPFGKTKLNYAEVFGNELASTFKKLGIDVELVWTHELYKTDEMKNMIRIGLEKNDEVKQIVAKFLTSSMTEDQKSSYLDQQKTWMGAMVICEKCNSTQKKLKDGTIKPNRVLKYLKDTDEVTYICPACSFEGKVKISSGLVKLNWRLDWPAKWTIYHTTCEPAGKDHCTPGGSYDTGLELCQKIYNYEGPVKVSYEWLRLGDRDMKTSKGIVFTPQKFLDMAKPEIIRMLIYQTNPNKHLSIRIEELEQYYNEYDRLEKIYFGLEEATSEQEKKEIEYVYPLIQSNIIPKEYPNRLPFKLVMVLAQMKSILGEKEIIEKAKAYLDKEGNGAKFEKDAFNEEIYLASNWIEEMKAIIESETNPQEVKKLKQKIVLFSFPESVTEEIRSKLDEEQKKALLLLLQKIKEIESITEENIKDMMINIREDLKIKPNKIFQAVYLIFLGEKRGPRIGPLLSMLNKNWIEERIEAALKL